jgi:hypothetical protein
MESAMKIRQIRVMPQGISAGGKRPFAAFMRFFRHLCFERRVERADRFLAAKGRDLAWDYLQGRYFARPDPVFHARPDPVFLYFVTPFS